MTATRIRRQSLADALDVERPLDAAAAEAAVESVALINEAIVASGLLQSQLARELGITEGRVSQVVNGDGNVRVSTLARFLRASGFELNISASPVNEAASPSEGDDVDAIHGPVYVAHKIVTCANEDGLWTSDVVEFSDTHPRTRLHEEYTYVHNLRTGESESLPEPVKREATPRVASPRSEARRVRA